MKKIIVNEVVPNQEYKVEREVDEDLLKQILNDIQCKSARIVSEIDDVWCELFGKMNADDEKRKSYYRSFQEFAEGRVPNKNDEADGFEKFKKDFGHEICDDQMLGTHKFINMLFRNYFRFTIKNENLLNNIEDLLHRQALENHINLFEIFDHLNLVDYTMEPELFERTMRRFFNIIWDEDNQLDISINVMSPADENDTAEFYIVFNSAPKWIFAEIF